MITNKELNEVSLSPTKKDYYQIWGELLDLASKISTRWSPDSTNESDPGVVLLKALTAIADKLNYNIDKNTLEAFMPSATQQESMRKLTEMMGYNMKYYQAASCKINVSYKETNEKVLGTDIRSIYFPKFTNIKNEEEDINYVTTEYFTLQEDSPSYQVNALEGMLVECETNSDNVISLVHLDDNNRYILPEANVAENGIFVCNIIDNNGVSKESDDWKQVDNLNAQLPGATVFKFGFDSNMNLPYIQFPDDISQLIKDGLRIRYIRTNGLMGNVAANILCKLEIPALWSTTEDGDLIRELTADNFYINNNVAAKNGANPETLTDAYNNFKKTIGTFDTLVTCRDYMNKIYQMTVSETDRTPLVSNIIVSDIRDDLNRATTICSFNEYGICYVDRSKQEIDHQTFVDKDNPTKSVNVDIKKDLINQFDLVFYPFKTVYGLNSKDEFVNSFKINNENMNKIKYDLKTNKTLSHNFCEPINTLDKKDIACIKNYLRLKSKITTVKKVNFSEETEILNNIFSAIYENFNCRKLDFGEEIPYESIYNVIKNADARIKDISLDEPVLYTRIMTVDNKESDIVTSDDGTVSGMTEWKKQYNKLALRNILAGRIAAFQYDTDFATNYAETTYPEYPNSIYPISDSDYKIDKLYSEFNLDSNNVDENVGYKLQENEVIQFRVPNLKTELTYPAYVNYYLILNQNSERKDAIPANFITINDAFGYPGYGVNSYWLDFVNNYVINDNSVVLTPLSGSTEVQFTTAKDEYGRIFTKDTFNKVTDEEYDPETFYCFQEVQETQDEDEQQIIKYIKVIIENADDFDEQKSKLYIKHVGTQYYIVDKYMGDGVQYYYFDPNKSINPQTKNFVLLTEYLKKLINDKTEQHDHTDPQIVDNRLFVIKRTDTTLIPGYLIDSSYNKYDAISSVQSGLTACNTFVALDLGKDATGFDVTKDADYQLQDNEYLYVNYTNTKTDESGVEKKSRIDWCYKKGTIIRPNFGMIDSRTYHNTHSYSKKDDFDFHKFNVSNPEGMFTLDSNEQIEIRDLVRIELDEADTLVYWNRNDENDSAASQEFTFNEDYPGGTNNAYTLKDGEYFYYTNSRKINIAYYGAGSIIVKGPNTPKLIKSTLDSNIKADDILTNGFDIVNWVPVKLDKDAKKITVVENQYITLTEGDTFYSATALTAAGTNNISNKLILSNDFTNISTARYKFAEETEDSVLPAINVTSLHWAARSRLDFNIGPNTPQTIHENDVIKLFSGKEEKLAIRPSAANMPVTLYSNYRCQVANHEINTKNIIEIYRSAVQKEVEPFKIKVTRYAPIELNPDSESALPVLNLDNYTSGNATYTKFSFKDIDTKLNANPAFKLNITIPETDLYGLIMFYYIDAKNHANSWYEEKVDVTSENFADLKSTLYTKDSEADTYTKVSDDAEFNADIKYYIQVIYEPAYIIAKALENNELVDKPIGRFNTDELVTKYYFKNDPKIQIIKLDPDVKQLEIYSDNLQESAIIFSKLSLVKGINPKLKYQYDTTRVSDDNGLSVLLKDIRDWGYTSDFYYNTPIEADYALDLNSAIDDDTLLNPAAWYDPNNINNKFVISEIAADYLATGITLTKTSRL